MSSPCHAACSTSDGQDFSLDDPTIESISEFLFRSTKEPTEATQKIKTIREDLLRFHPDKSEGRVMSRSSRPRGKGPGRSRNCGTDTKQTNKNCQLAPPNYAIIRAYLNP